jgi:hypothetical protein
MTFASDLLKRQTSDRTHGDVYSDQWFSSVKRHSVHEDSKRITDDLVLTLLWWKDERPLIQIDEEEERRAYRRSDWREE